MSDQLDVYEGSTSEVTTLRGTAGTSPFQASEITDAGASDLSPVNSVSLEPKISSLDGIVNLLNDFDAVSLPEFISKAAGFIKEPSKMASIIEQLLSTYILDRVGNIGLPDSMYDTFKKKYLPKCIDTVLSSFADKSAVTDYVAKIIDGGLEDPAATIESSISDFVDNFLQEVG